MGCCGGRRREPGVKVLGYYVIRPDGTQIPDATIEELKDPNSGKRPLSRRDARLIMERGGGTSHELTHKT